MSSTDEQTNNGLHFVALVHGLWGSPKHLDNVANTLRQAHADDKLHTLIVKSNEGSFTYDGIETGAERVTQEIEQELDLLKKSGKEVTKFSLIGYSLGGLIARYSIGLLYSKGIFDTITPINFLTFATPHLGTRTPLVGWHSHIYNYLGGRTLSLSGNQLWLLDDFRETGRPLLSLLADPDSIFIKALSSFKYRTLYANIVNDRAVPFYTAFISRTDPFTDLNAIEVNYDSAYERVILDPVQPAKPRTTALSLYDAIAGRTSTIGVKIPFYIFISLAAPIGSIAFLLNAGYQTITSASRIKEHQQGNAGISTSAYRIPFMMEGVRKRTEEALQKLNQAQNEELLPQEDQPKEVMQENHSEANGHAIHPSSKQEETDGAKEDAALDNRKAQPLQAYFPHLALAPEQFTMADNLDELGFTKYAVHIHRASHSHAAMIMRTNRIGFGEGKVVLQHFVERFEI